MNVYNTRPVDLQPGDHIFVLVKAIVGPQGEFSLYRCMPPDELQFPEIPEYAIPQGSQLLRAHSDAVADAIMPVLTWYHEMFEEPQRTTNDG